MEFWKVILGLIRRKIVILPLLTVTVTLGLAGYFLTPLKYVSSTTMVLVTPAFGGTLSQDPARATDLTNPLLNFNENLKTASAILIYAMNTPEVAAELGTLDGPTELKVDDGRTNPDLILNNGPFVYIVGESTSRTEAYDVVIRAQQRMRQELIDRQKALTAPPETYVTLDDVVAPTDPEVSRTDRIKVGGIAFIVSVFMGLSAAYAWQRLRADPRRAIGEQPPAKANNSLYWSWDWDLDRRLDPGAHQASAIEASERAVGELTDGEQPVNEDTRDAARPVTTRPQAAEEEQHTGDKVANDHKSPTVRIADDDAHSDRADQSAKPEQVVYPAQAIETTVPWKLYFADHPLADGQPGHSFEDEVDLGWSGNLEGLDFHRISPVGVQKKG